VFFLCLKSWLGRFLWFLRGNSCLLSGYGDLLSGMGGLLSEWGFTVQLGWFTVGFRDLLSSIKVVLKVDT
jgi:hypothetical protein